MRTTIRAPAAGATMASLPRRSPLAARPSPAAAGNGPTPCHRRALQRAAAAGNGSGAESSQQDDRSSSTPPRFDATGRPVAEAAAVTASVDGAAASSSPSNLFLEPLARNFILGVVAGVSCEALHVASKFVTAGSGAAQLLTDHSDQLRPLFIADHAVAIGAWVLLYAIEAAAISAVLRRFKDDTRAAAAEVQSMPTLPKRLFPAPLNKFKAALYRTAKRAFLGRGAAALTPATSLDTATGTTPLTSIDDDSIAASAAAAAAAFSAGASAAVATPEAPPQASAPRSGSGLSPADLERLERALSGEAAPAAPERASRPRRGGDGDGDGDNGDEGEGERRRGAVRRDEELTERRSYLKNFWYAAALSEKLLPGKPLGVDILGTRLVLFRDQETGEITALDDACPHRGAPLSAGWLAQKQPVVTEGNKGGCSSSGGKAAGGGKKEGGLTCVVCPYHGWAFDGEGRLRDVPSADRGSWPKRPLVGSYSVVERGGFVWLFYGDPRMPMEERPPVPTTPELEDPSWRAVYGEIEFDCGHWGVFENAIDMAHIHYLHGDSFGNQDKPRVMDMTTSRDAFSCTAQFRIHNKPVNPLWEWTAVPSVPVTARAMLPSTSAVTITLAHGVQMITFVNTVPISADRAINRFCLIRNFATSPAFDFVARKEMYKILNEDKVMVDKLRAEALPAEYSLAPDGPQIEFRRLRHEWASLGYAVPPEAPDRPKRGLLDEGRR